MTIPTTERLDEELRRRDPVAAVLEMLPDDELAELLGLLDGMDGNEPLDTLRTERSPEARQAWRLWRRAEARHRHNVRPSQRAPAEWHYPLERLPGTDSCVAKDPGCRCVHWVLDRGGTPLEFWTEHLRVQRVRDERRRLREEPSPATTPFWERAAPDPTDPAKPGVSVLSRVRRQPPARFPAVDPLERLEELGLRVIHGRGAE